VIHAGVDGTRLESPDHRITGSPECRLKDCHCDGHVAAAQGRTDMLAHSAINCCDDGLKLTVPRLHFCRHAFVLMSTDIDMGLELRQ
jgi:hypothetical protein